MKTIDLIDGYLSGTLEKADRRAFDKALSTDPDFIQEFQDVKEIQEGIKSLSRKETLAFLQEVEQEITTNESTLNNDRMKKTIVAAASFILIAAFSFFALPTNTQDSSLQSIYQNNFESYDNIYGIVRGEDQQESSLESQAFRAYDMGNYDLAAQGFAELVKADRSAINYLYMGLSNLEANNTNEAITHLNATLNNFDQFDSQAKWYLALAHLSVDDENAAVSNLVSLTLENSIYKTKAEAVLKEMGLTATSLDGGTVGDVKLRPSDENDSPDGSFEGRRQVQFGYVISATNGYRYNFLTDQPIRGLHVGSEVEMIVLRQNDRKRSGFAFILGER